MTVPPPSSVLSGSPFSLSVAAEDADGNLDTSYSGNMTIALVGNTASGTSSLTEVIGVATLSHLARSGSDTYVLVASGDNLADSDPQPTTVTNKAAFLVQPPNSVLADSPFSLS